MVMEKKFLEGLMIRMFFCQDTLHQGPQIFQKSRSHLKILGIITVTEQVDSMDTQFCSDLWTLLLPVAFCSVLVAHIFM